LLCLEVNKGKMGREKVVDVDVVGEVEMREAGRLSICCCCCCCS
jgi:hypothetical protein